MSAVKKKLKITTKVGNTDIKHKLASGQTFSKSDLKEMIGRADVIEDLKPILSVLADNIFGE